MAPKQRIFSLTGKVPRESKESLLEQRGTVIWLFGLSGSGKSTIAKALEHLLFGKGYATVLIDGDDLRNGINTDLGFSAEHRVENLRRAAEIAKLFLNNGIITICSFITPTEISRKMVKEIVGNKECIQVFVKCSVEECERRDVKGLYKLAKEDKLSNFTGVSSAFEIPTAADVEVDTERLNLDAAIEEICRKIIDKIKLT